MRSILNQKRLKHDYINESKSLSLLTDDELIRCIADGEYEAFTDLYKRYSVPLYNFIIRLTREPYVAEEILQESFLAIWKGAHTFKAKSKVKTWVFQIAHYQAVTWLRKNRPMILSDPIAEREPSPEVGPEEISLQTSVNESLYQAMESLSPEQRAVVELYYVHGMSYKEISYIVKIPMGTIKSRMRFALQNLRRALKRIE